MALLTVQAPGLIAQDTPGVVLDETSGVAERLDDYLTRPEALGLSGGIIFEHKGKVVLRKGSGSVPPASRRHPPQCKTCPP